MDFWNDAPHGVPQENRSSQSQQQGQSGTHWVTINGRHVLIDEAPEGRAELSLHELHKRIAAMRRGHHGDDYDPATTSSGVVNQIYNETSGLRPTTQQDGGPGSDWDLQQARTAIGHVIQNRRASGMPGGLASDQLTTQASEAIQTVGSPAYDAHGASVYAAHRAAGQPDPTGGAKYFYLDHGTKRPPFLADKERTATFGPFRNSSGGGDIPKGANVWIEIYR